MLPFKRVIGQGLPLTSHYSIILDRSPHNHDGIMEGAFCLLNELFGPAPQDHGACLGLRTACEDVESVGGREPHVQGTSMCNSYKLHPSTTPISCFYNSICLSTYKISLRKPCPPSKLHQPATPTTSSHTQMPHPPLSPNLLFLEEFAATKHLVSQSTDRCLDGAPTGPHGPAKILLRNTASTEHISEGVREGVREGGREGGSEGGRAQESMKRKEGGGREGVREGGREGVREGGGREGTGDEQRTGEEREGIPNPHT